MTIKIDPSVGDSISDTCRNAAYAALWAEANPRIAAEHVGKWARLVPLFKMKERGTTRTPDDHPVGYQFLAAREIAAEGSDLGGHRFWQALRDEYGQTGIPAENVVTRYTGRGRALRTPYIDVLIDGPGLDVEFNFNDALVTQPPLAGSPKGDYDNEVDLNFVAYLAGELQAQCTATMKANSDAYWTPERKATAAREQTARDEKDAHRRAQTDVARAAHPFKPKAGTEAEYAGAVAKNEDPYGGRCHSYAADWASLMDQAVAKGSTVEACAKETSRMADYDGITGFMYGAAVSILSHFWGRGDELRRWHNLDTQVGNEGEKANESGGTLNPALMSVSVPE